MQLNGDDKYKLSDEFEDYDDDFKKRIEQAETAAVAWVTDKHNEAKMHIEEKRTDVDEDRYFNWLSDEEWFDHLLWFAVCLRWCVGLNIGFDDATYNALVRKNGWSEPFCFCPCGFRWLIYMGFHKDMNEADRCECKDAFSIEDFMEHVKVGHPTDHICFPCYPFYHQIIEVYAKNLAASNHAAPSNKK